MPPLFALLIAGCSSIGDVGGGTGGPATTGSSPSLTERMRSTLFGGTAGATPAAAAAPSEETDCPVVDVRQGASTLTTYGRGGEQVATNVRYQGTIGEYARECSFAGGMLTMKVGVQGRLIMGPAGDIGSLDVPLRIALVQEGANPKTLWTKLYRVPVSIAPGQSNVPFVHVENGISVPKPSPPELESYVLYVGFDQQALGEKPQRAQRRRR